MPGYSISDGWLLYVGKLGGQDVTLTGKTSYVSISMNRDPFYAAANTTHVQATMYAADLKHGKPAPRCPVDPEALLILARRHRAEYDKIREQMAILRALGG
jgi:hypothetical protein